MNSSLPVLALVVAGGLPLAAYAQQNGAAENGPPPAVRAQMQQTRDAAKTAAFNDLSAADRAKVQTVIDAVNNGQQTDLRAAAQQIDAALTPAETTAVLGERTKMVAAIHANMAAMPNAPQGGPQGGPPPGARVHSASAGRFLLMLGVSREKMHELRHAQQPQAPTKP